MGYTGAIRLSRAVVLLHRLGTLLGPDLVARRDVFDALVAGCNSEGSSSSSCQIEYMLPRALVSLVSATRDETQASAGAGGGRGCYQSCGRLGAGRVYSCRGWLWWWRG